MSLTAAQRTFAQAAPAASRSRIACRASAAQTSTKPESQLLALNVTKSNLVGSQGGKTTRNIDGVVYSIVYDEATDSISVTDTKRSLGFPATVGEKDNRIRIDLSAPSPVANGVPSFTALQQVLKGDGPGPEAINGRLAMVSFLVCCVAEVTTQKTVLEQATTLPGAFGAIGLATFVSAASLAPMLLGKVSPYQAFPNTNDSYGDRQMPFYFTAIAEAINGRAAMLGIAALVINELVRGQLLL